MINNKINTDKKFANKLYFAGISLGSSSTSETGVAVLDQNLNIVTLDKLFSIDDVKFFLNNLVGKQNAIINISMCENPLMLNAKWKLASRQYQLLHNSDLINHQSDWIKRYSNRGTDYFKELKESGIDVFRYDVRELKSSLSLSGVYKDRSPVDCKSLQSALRYRFGISELPSNMLPVSQLEAILGAYLGVIMTRDSTGYECKVRTEYSGLEVIGLDL